MAGLEQVIKHQVLEATRMVEEHLDFELQKFEKLESNDIRKFREQRLRELKKEEQQKQEWITKGHGEYNEIDERDFFDVVKKCPNVICHFYKTDTMRCGIVDNHLKILTAKHLEVKVCKINAEKAPFLTGRLNICIIPTILLIKDSLAIDRIVGFTDLGNCDDFSTEMLEWRIAVSGIIDYSGDIAVPPECKKTNWISILGEKRKVVRESISYNSSDDEF